ncbi:uncharacterized protein VTP21DRAFT_2915 [Calcarisporiella thermophila]|uniref:uncharacterized protein n=1 Tax=Calcarisporiella thermophila TaxID=911321 RepID=UPI00374469E7
MRFATRPDSTVSWTLSWSIIAAICSLFGVVGAIKQHTFSVLIFSIYNQISLLLSTFNILSLLLGLGSDKFEWPDKDICNDKRHPDQPPTEGCLSMINMFPFIIGFSAFLVIAVQAYFTFVIISYHRQLREKDDLGEGGNSPFLSHPAPGYQAVATTKV